ncbi:MAG: tyrosine-type recombinase/integrase [Candidatus Omnitrophota bacterium]|jgi:site-specific recombinase XerD
MGQIRKRGAYWYVDLYLPTGRRYRRRVSRSKQLAELALKDLEVKAERNQLGFLDRKEASVKTFLEDYLQYSRTNHRLSTTVRYRSAIKNFREFIEKISQVVNLRDITPEILERYKQHRKTADISKNGKKGGKSKDGTIQKGAKSYTVNFELGTLRTIFNLAIRQKYLDENPVREVGFLKPDDSKKRRFLTEVECDRLLHACEPEYYPIFFTLIHTGMRKAELLNLEWSDLDCKRRVIKIQRKSFWVPKTGEREIPMAEAVYDVLDALPRQSHFVFPDEDGESMNGNFLRLQLIRIAKNAAIYDLTEVHALRHTFASQLLMRGVDLPTVQKLMGHSKIETTLIYSHQTTDHLREAVEKLSHGEKQFSSV